MNEIILQNKDGKILASSRDVAEKFGKNHKEILRSISNISKEISTAQFCALFKLSNYKASNGKTNKEYLMNRDGFSLLVMGFTGKEALDWKVKYIEAFNEMEKKLNDPEFLVQRSMDYLKSRCDALLLENKELKPKALFADAVSASNESILIGQLAKLIRQNGYEIGQNRLFEWMRENEYLIKKGERYNQPTQKSMDLGLFEVKERTITNPDGSTRITLTTKVTGKGQVYFINKFLS